MSLLKVTLKRRVIPVFGILLLGLVGIVFRLQSSQLVKHHIDAFIGIGAAIFAVASEQFIEVLVQWHQFHRLEGNYRGNWYVIEQLDENGKPRELKDPDDPDEIEPNGSIATIRYLGDTSLEMIVTEDNSNQNQWTGRVIMESHEVGIMAWAYNYLGPRNDSPWRRNGIKRFSVVGAKTKPLKLCIFSYQDTRFGREIFIKDNRLSHLSNGGWPKDWLPAVLWIALSVFILFLAQAFK